MAERKRPRNGAVLILSAYPSRAAAERAARSLVRDRVLACATVVPGGKAFYRWNGKEHAVPSALLWGKTVASRTRAALKAIRDRHPDTVPEILVLPVQGGHAPYLKWLAGEVR
ncbi:MAG TPA: divalent cation tolerance protein CutA [Candidatus Eisenbacteria bacterium]|nr:divalent cation tolerance protein CutA [Candidatus Eisenbacteria bacterium]